MIKKGDKLIIIAEALEDENNGTVYVKLTSDSQSHMTMLTENCIVAPKPRTIEKYSSPVELGYNVALRECGVLEDDSNKYENAKELL